MKTTALFNTRRLSFQLSTERWLGGVTICVLVKTIDAKEGVGLFDLLGSDLCHGLNWVQTTVLSQRHWDHLHSISKGPHGILFQCWTLKTNKNKYHIAKKNNKLWACWI